MDWAMPTRGGGCKSQHTAHVKAMATQRHRHNACSSHARAVSAEQSALASSVLSMPLKRLRTMQSSAEGPTGGLSTADTHTHTRYFFSVRLAHPPEKAWRWRGRREARVGADRVDPTGTGVGEGARQTHEA